MNVIPPPVWLLCLNDMRMDHYEDTIPVAKAASKEALEELLKREKVEPYQDGQWGKNFRQGGPLEWCNPPCVSIGGIQCLDIEARVRTLVDRLTSQLVSVPDA